eukprot:gnl/Hemi2/17591_TR5803_c0_g1_i1.p1 gnl/Hemi2/17591_TR5803_c0_g1~~gnl/Hemi2/17591_TR5803_c0_g1_i1.p1  ORF type:complete len:280 (+),score=91.47 gnl/Hemi2/17591_TR5803_c0_g1_i1:82-921(+)
MSKAPAPAAATNEPLPDLGIPNLELKRKLSEGSFGVVYGGIYRGHRVAVKVLKFDGSVDPNILLDEFLGEVRILSSLNHPNVMKLIDATQNAPYALITEFCSGGTLYSLLRGTPAPSWRSRLSLAQQMASAMVYMHSFNPPIAHRDLKTENVLLDSDGKVKVCDFGFAKVREKSVMGTFCGSISYIAPEVVTDMGYTEKADVYSFAIILWEIATLTDPYRGFTDATVLRDVPKNLRPGPIPADAPAGYAALVEDCWHADPNQRPPFTAILDRLKRIAGN